MAVMNDRSQAGSAYMKGRLELMLNRRLLKDDDLGMNEALNEVDENGQGLNVSATFVVKITRDRSQIFDTMSDTQYANTVPL